MKHHPRKPWRRASSAQAAGSWTDDEPGYDELVRDVRLALRRVRPRAGVALLVAVLATAFVTYRKWSRPPKHEASLVVRVTERGVEEDTQPPTVGELNQLIIDTFLGRSTLLAAIEELDLYPDKMGPDPSLAIEAFRDDLDIQVVQNYFDAERYVASKVRSARIKVAYLGKTPHQAIAVARHLTDAFRAEQVRRRRAAAEASARQARLRHEALARHNDLLLSQLSDTDGIADGHLALVQRYSLRMQLGELARGLDQSARAEAKHRVRVGLERRDLGLRMEVIDTGKRPTPLLDRTTATALTGVLGFLVLLPLSFVGLGTLSTRIASPGCAERIGVRTLAPLDVAFPRSPRSTT